MLEQLTSDTFSPHLGESFELLPPGGEPFEIVLTSCDQASGTDHPGTRAPFSLIFHAAPNRLVAQQICVVSHPRVGRLELFVVPIGPDEQGMRYQVVFG